MFLHQVKMNWKKYRKPAKVILLVTLIRVYLETGLGWPPLNYLGMIKLALVSIGAMVGWAFLETLWHLGTAYFKTLCTFVVAARKFCRDYWSNKATAA